MGYKVSTNTMTYEEMILEKYHTDADFAERIKKIRNYWGIGGKKYKTVEDYLNDITNIPHKKSGKLTKKGMEFLLKEEFPWPYKVRTSNGKLRELSGLDIKIFFSEIDKIVEDFHLRERADVMIHDLIRTRRLSQKHYQRIFLEKTERNINNLEDFYILLRIYPGATLRDLRTAYKEYVGKIIREMNSGKKINQPLRENYPKKLIKLKSVPKIKDEDLEKIVGVKKNEVDKQFWSGKTIPFRRAMTDAKYRKNKRLKARKRFN